MHQKTSTFLSTVEVILLKSPLLQVAKGFVKRRSSRHCRKRLTVGSRSFVTSFQLAGVSGVISETAEDAFREIDALTDDKDVGLVLVSDDVSNPISDKLTKLRTVKSAIVFSLPAVGSSKSTIDYRSMLKKILGV